MLADATITPQPVRVARRRVVTVRFPVSATGRTPRARRAAAQLVLGRRCRRRVVA